MPFIPEDKFQKHLSNRALGYLLLDSAYDGKPDRVVALLEDGASVDAVDEKTGMTALHIAVGRNNLEIARILVERGASFIADKQGRMPTTIAAEWSKQSAIVISHTVEPPASEPDPEPAGHCSTAARRPEKCLFAAAGGSTKQY